MISAERKAKQGMLGSFFKPCSTSQHQNPHKWVYLQIPLKFNRQSLKNIYDQTSFRDSLRHGESSLLLTRLTIKKSVRDTHRAIRLKTMRFLSLNASQLTILLCCKKSIKFLTVENQYITLRTSHASEFVAPTKNSLNTPFFLVFSLNYFCAKPPGKRGSLWIKYL